MEAKVKLLYRSYLTHFHTFMPVYFYGTPGGKIYCVYTRFNQRFHNETNLEIVFLQHKDLTYDYDLNLVFDNESNVIPPEIFKNQIDQSEQQYSLMKLHGRFKSYAEVQEFLNDKVVDNIRNLELEHA